MLLACGTRRVVHGRVANGTARAALDGVKERFALEVRVLKTGTGGEVRPALLTDHGSTRDAANPTHEEGRTPLPHAQVRSHGLRGAHHLTREDPGAKVHAPLAQEHRERERAACRGPGNTAFGHEAAATLLGDEVALLHQRLDRPTNRATAHAIALAELGLRGDGLSVAPRAGIYLVSQEHL